MTDKEKIIIDGVDVSGCEYVCNTAFGNIGCKLPFNEEIHCCNNPNCHYKQLKRKEQECEELKVQLKNSENARNYAEKVCIDIELKKKIYEQALDEIKSVVSSTLDCGEWIGQGDNKMENILNIINKAKDGKNEKIHL